MVRHWKKLPREAVIGPNLTEFKKCLDIIRHIVVFLGLYSAESNPALVILVGPF